MFFETNPLDVTFMTLPLLLEESCRAQGTPLTPFSFAFLDANRCCHQIISWQRLTLMIVASLPIGFYRIFRAFRPDENRSIFILPSFQEGVGKCHHSRIKDFLVFRILINGSQFLLALHTVAKFYFCSKRKSIIFLIN